MIFNFLKTMCITHPHIGGGGAGKDVIKLEKLQEMVDKGIQMVGLDSV